MQRTPPELKSAARSLRRDATDAERKFWQAIRPLRPRFTRQLVISHFIADFACRQLRLIVELDGGQHALTVEQDAARTAYLEAYDWQVLRFWNNDVLGNLEGVLTVLATAMESRASTHPQPLPFREGS